DFLLSFISPLDAEHSYQCISVPCVYPLYLVFPWLLGFVFFLMVPEAIPLYLASKIYRRILPAKNPWANYRLWWRPGTRAIRLRRGFDPWRRKTTLTLRLLLLMTAVRTTPA